MFGRLFGNRETAPEATPPPAEIEEAPAALEPEPAPIDPTPPASFAAEPVAADPSAPKTSWLQRLKSGLAKTISYFEASLTKKDKAVPRLASGDEDKAQVIKFRSS